ncbi:MAG TPA: alpha/beta fold hydrolase [Pseudonocardiaceae bacterium]|nr:alpha/beta fold hydrolase [Pseudonocardiaceae bacterium]
MFPRWLAVLVPDHGESLDRFDTMAAALVTAGAVVVPANSDAGWAPVVDFEPHVDALAALVEHAEPGLPVVLVGHAVGGMIVVRYAQRHPGRAAALVLSAPVLGAWPALDLLSEDEIPPQPYGPYERATLAAIEMCLATIDFDHPLGDDLPALWLHGVEDGRVPMADTRAGLDRVRGLRFEERIYPGAGHELRQDDAVFADVTEFVGRVVQFAGSGGDSGPSTGV